MAGDNNSNYEDAVEVSVFEKSEVNEKNELNLNHHPLLERNKCPLCCHAHDSYTSCSDYERMCQMIICENVPQELPPDVVRYNSRSDTGLDAVQINLTSLRQRFESGSESDYENQDQFNGSSPCFNNNSHRNNRDQPLDLNRFGLRKSDSVLLRLKRYQSVVSGDIMSVKNEDDSMGEDEEINSCHESKRKEKAIPFAGLSALKSQWESGSLNENNNNEPDEGDGGGGGGGGAVEGDVKEELFKLRQRICLGRSASMKQIYEKGGPELSIAKSNGFTGETAMVASKIKVISIKEKFEKGQVVKDAVEDKLHVLKREKLTDLSVVVDADTAAREAKKIFKQMDRSLSKESNGHVNGHASHPPPAVNGKSKGNIKGKNGLARSSTIAVFRNGFQNGFQSAPPPPTSPSKKNEEEVPADLVRYSDPVEKEDLLIDTTAVQERYKFFEEFKDSPKEPRRFEMTPPREACNGTAEIESTPVRDPNVIRCSDIIDDIPKTDTAKKMLDVFKQLESQSKEPTSPVNGTSSSVSKLEPKSLKRITPPRELDVPLVVKEEDKIDAPVPEVDDQIVRSSTKSEPDVIPVEPEMARILRAKFENWANEFENNNKNHNHNGHYDLPEDFTPQLDKTKSLKAKFESFSSNDSLQQNGIERRRPRVNRFVKSVDLS